MQPPVEIDADVEHNRARMSRRRCTAPSSAAGESIHDTASAYAHRLAAVGCISTGLARTGTAAGVRPTCNCQFRRWAADRIAPHFPSLSYVIIVNHTLNVCRNSLAYLASCLPVCGRARAGFSARLRGSASTCHRGIPITHSGCVARAELRVFYGISGGLMSSCDGCASHSPCD